MKVEIYDRLSLIINYFFVDYGWTCFKIGDKSQREKSFFNLIYTINDYIQNYDFRVKIIGWTVTLLVWNRPIKIS